MFDFFQNIFGTVISLMASIIIAVGLVSMPAIPEQPLPEIKQPVVIQEIVSEKKPENMSAKSQQKTEIKESQIKEPESAKPIIETPGAVEKDKKIQAEEIRKRVETLQNEITLAEKEQKPATKQPRLILFQDNLGNVYTEEKDFVRIAAEPFNHGFGASYTPLCLKGISNTAEDCQTEIINWINDRSIEIGKNLNITLGGFDANGDDVFYLVSYGSGKDFGFGNMRVLQLWGTNNNFNLSITGQLYNETLSENLGWSSTFFEPEARKYYQKYVELNNAGGLNIHLCFNDEPQKMEYPHGKQFTDGCVLFKYFILKPGYSELIISEN